MNDISFGKLCGNLKVFSILAQPRDFSSGRGAIGKISERILFERMTRETRRKRDSWKRRFPAAEGGS